MQISQVGNSLIKVAIFCACVYGVVKWQAGSDQSGDVVAFAEKACTDAIGARYNVSNIRLYDVREDSSGYALRASVTLSSGRPAKVTCLANVHGGVRDIIIDER